MGEWETIRRDVWETVVTPCACCGQVVARRLWGAEVEGEVLRFCGPDCEELYRTYVLPRRARLESGGHDRCS